MCLHRLYTRRMADRDDIERVRQATNIVELIEGVTTVKKSGRAVMAVCPVPPGEDGVDVR